MGVYTKIDVPEFTLPKPLPCKTTPPPTIHGKISLDLRIIMILTKTHLILMIVRINLIPKYNTWSKEYHNHYDVEHPHVYTGVS